MYIMKTILLSILAIAMVMAPASSRADIQLDIGPVLAYGGDSDTWGFDLGAGFYTKHNTSPLASAFLFRYMYLGDIDTEETSLNTSSNYNFLGGNYRLYFPLMPDDRLQLFGSAMLGATRLDGTLETVIGDLDSTEWALSWGLGGGVLFNFTPNVGGEIGYTYFGIDEPSVDGFSMGDSSLHLWRFGLVFRF